MQRRQWGWGGEASPSYRTNTNSHPKVNLETPILSVEESRRPREPRQRTTRKLHTQDWNPDPPAAGKAHLCTAAEPLCGNSQFSQPNTCSLNKTFYFPSSPKTKDVGKKRRSKDWTEINVCRSFRCMKQYITHS